MTNEQPRFLVQAYRHMQAAPFFSTVKRAATAEEARRKAFIPSGATQVTVDRIEVQR